MLDRCRSVVDAPGSAVEKFAGCVEVPDVARGLGGDVEQDFSQAVESPRTERRVGPPYRCCFGRRVSDDRRCERGFVAIAPEYVVRAGVEYHIPRFSAAALEFGGNGRFASDDASEPESLDIEGEMVDEAETCPSRRQDRSV